MSRRSHSHRRALHAPWTVCALAAIAVATGGFATRTAVAHAPPPQLLEVARHGSFTGGDLQVKAENSGGLVRVQLANHYAAPVTADMSFELVNLEATRPVRTVTVPAHGHAEVALFRQVDASHRFTYRYVMKWLFGDPLAVPADTLYDLPFGSGPGFRVLQGYFGGFSHAEIAAIDWGMPEGTPVLASREGVVVATKDDAVGNGLDPEFKLLDRANWVVVRHPDGTMGCYFHLQPHGVRVQPGQTVTRGQAIALSGNTGYSTQPHLHFEVRSPIDGTRYRTFAVRYRTLGGDPAGEIPLAGNLYQAP